MAIRSLSAVMQHLRRAARPQDGAVAPDAHLLECFLTRGDQAALATLVQRHAALVWGVCRRALGDGPDAEDAFQATFLVLVRRASSVRLRGPLVNWLYGVARQTARKARQVRGRRRGHERQVDPMPEPAVTETGPDRELRALLDEELNRLPERYRAAILLCDSEGLTRKEAARRLGVREGTLSGHLTRGRALLAARLTRRGVALSAGVLSAACAKYVAAAPPALVRSTTAAAIRFAAGAGPSAAVARLTEEVLKAMSANHLKGALALLVGAILTLGLAAVPWAVARPGAQEPAGQTPQAPDGPRAKKPRWRDSLTIKHEHPVNLVVCGATWSAASDEGGNLYVWDTATGKKRTLRLRGGKGMGATESVDHLRLTLDGKYLYGVVSGGRGLCRLSLGDKDERSPGVMSRNPIFLGVSPDGETWLEVHGGRTLALRPNPWVRAALYEPVKYTAKVTHAALSADEKWLAAVTDDGVLHLHDRATLRETEAVAVPKDMVSAIQFSPDGKRIAIVARDSTARIHDTGSGKQVAELKGHGGIVFAVAFRPDGKLVVTGGDDNTARLWDAETGRPLGVLKGHTDSVRSVAFDPSGETLVTGSADKTVKVWKLAASLPGQGRAPESPEKPPKSAPARARETAGPVQVTPEAADLLKAARDRMVIAEQRMQQLLNEAIRKAEREYEDEPDAALGRLRTVMTRVLDNPDLRERTRGELLLRAATTWAKLTGKE